MRILFWADGFWPYIGGVETFATGITHALHQRGHDVEVISSHRGLDLPDTDVWEGIPIHRLSMHQALSDRNVDLYFQNTQRITAIVQRFQPDIVHSNFSEPSAVFHLRNKALQGVPWVLSYHGLVSPTGASDDTLMRAMFNSANRITACSQSLVDDLLAIAPDIASKTEAVYYGILTPDVAPTPLPWPARFLCLGRMVEEKGFDLAIRAFASIADRFPETRLVLAGDGPAMPDLLALAESLGVRARIEHTGWLRGSQIAAVVNECTIGIVPSRWKEPFGLVAVEASQLGRPVIAAATGGLVEAVEDQVTGLHFEPENAASLAMAMTTLLENPDRATAMGEAGRERTGRLFSFEREVQDFERLYDDVRSETAHV